MQHHLLYETICWKYLGFGPKPAPEMVAVQSEKSLGVELANLGSGPQVSGLTPQVLVAVKSDPVLVCVQPTATHRAQPPRRWNDIARGNPEDRKHSQNPNLDKVQLMRVEYVVSGLLMICIASTQHVLCIGIM